MARLCAFMIKQRLTTTDLARLLERSGLSIHAEPKGGIFVWAEAPDVQDSSLLASEAVQAGIMLAPSNISARRCRLRFNLTYSQDPRLERFLGEAINC